MLYCAPTSEFYDLNKEKEKEAEPLQTQMEKDVTRMCQVDLCKCPSAHVVQCSSIFMAPQFCHKFFCVLVSRGLFLLISVL